MAGPTPGKKYSPGARASDSLSGRLPALRRAGRGAVPPSYDPHTQQTPLVPERGSRRAGRGRGQSPLQQQVARGRGLGFPPSAAAPVVSLGIPENKGRGGAGAPSVTSRPASAPKVRRRNKASDHECPAQGRKSESGGGQGPQPGVTGHEQSVLGSCGLDKHAFGEKKDIGFCLSLGSALTLVYPLSLPLFSYLSVS
jgi:hypothetical protein